MAPAPQAVISPVGGLTYEGDSEVINNGEIGEVTQKLYDTLTGIQFGKQADDMGWIVTSRIIPNQPTPADVHLHLPVCYPYEKNQLYRATGSGRQQRGGGATQPRLFHRTAA